MRQNHLDCLRLIPLFVTTAALYSSITSAQSRIEIISGNNQIARFADDSNPVAPLPNPIVVRVTRDGIPLANESVVFSAPAYRGLRFAFDSAEQTQRTLVTDSDGMASLAARVFPTGTFPAPEYKWLVYANVSVSLVGSSFAQAHTVHQIAVAPPPCPGELPAEPFVLSVAQTSASPIRVAVNPSPTNASHFNPEALYFFLDNRIADYRHDGANSFTLGVSVNPTPSTLEVQSAMPGSACRFVPVRSLPLSLRGMNNSPASVETGVGATLLTVLISAIVAIVLLRRVD